MTLFKKSVSSRTLGIVTILLCEAIYADEHKTYVQLNAGAVFPFTARVHFSDSIDHVDVTNNYDPGYAAGLAIGYHLAEQFRVEAEVLYQSNDFYMSVILPNNPSSERVNGERMRMAVLFNTYYDFKNRTPFTPYITVGVGGNYVEFKANSSAIRNDFDVAYQVGAGVNYRVNDSFSLDMKYRYFSGTEPQFKTVDNRFNKLFDVNDHQLMVGIRIGF